MTSAAWLSASADGGKCRLGTAMTVMHAAAAAAIPLVESSIATHRSGSARRPAAAARYTSGAGLPRATSSDDTVTANEERRPLASRNSSMIVRFDDDASPSGHADASRSTAPRAPGGAVTGRGSAGRRNRRREKRSLPVRDPRRAARAGTPTIHASSCPSCLAWPTPARFRPAPRRATGAASSQIVSESTSTPSRSKITAATSVTRNHRSLPPDAPRRDARPGKGFGGDAIQRCSGT